MPIYVVGAGPGDPELLTLKAVKLLEAADVVALGDLVPVEVVKRHAPRVRVVRIGHRREEHWRAVEALLDEARAGKTVVVLKNGDPTIFGRGLAICREAQRAGVPCQVVPGVSSFTAAAALHGIDLTGGDLRHVALLAYPHVDSGTIRSVAADTLVIFMMGGSLAKLAEALGSCRRRPEVHLCVAVSTGGGCTEVDPRDLPSHEGARPALVIVKYCHRHDHPPALKEGALSGEGSAPEPATVCCKAAG